MLQLRANPAHSPPNPRLNVTERRIKAQNRTKPKTSFIISRYNRFLSIHNAVPRSPHKRVRQPLSSRLDSSPAGRDRSKIPPKFRSGLREAKRYQNGTTTTEPPSKQISQAESPIHSSFHSIIIISSSFLSSSPLVRPAPPRLQHTDDAPNKIPSRHPQQQQQHLSLFHYLHCFNGILTIHRPRRLVSCSY